MPKSRYLLPLWISFAAALGVQVVLSRVNFYYLDLLTVFLIQAALTRPVPSSMGAGIAAGLAADTLSGGLFGVHGLVFCLEGYAAARLAQLLVTDTRLLQGTFLACAACFHLLGVRLVEYVFSGKSAAFNLTDLLLTVAVTALAGLAALHGLRSLEAFLERRRYGR
jgi:rod shape-determining protein MreD